MEISTGDCYRKLDDSNRKPQRWSVTVAPSDSHNDPDSGRREDTSGRRNVLRYLHQIPSILLGTAFAILDNVPYGLLIFQGGGDTVASLGATLVLESTITAQIMFAIQSAFPFGVGACNVENVPFFSAISRSVALQVSQHGRPPEDAVSTCILVFAIGTFLSAIAFWALARFKVGACSEYLPKHVLFGCINGMGLFIVFAAVGIASGTDWAWDLHSLEKQFEGGAVVRWSVTVLLEVLLLWIGRKVDSILFVPCFLLLTPVAFYLVLYLIGVPISAARADGWIFNFLDFSASSSSSSSGGTSWSWRTVLSNFCIWSDFSPRRVDWRAASSQLTTVLASVFFSVIHPPLNVRPLSLQTKIESDLDHEFLVHGNSNFLSAIFGGTQNYMTYSSSILLSTCGMVDRWASASVALLSSIFIACGPAFALSFFPRPAAAIFLMHVGMVLVKDSVVESWAELDAKEYIVVWVIGLAMQWDFMQGLAIGAVFSVFTFLVHLSRLEVAEGPIEGSGLRSNQLRPRRESEKLDHLMAQVQVLILKGNLFFGNINQLLAVIKKLYDSCPEDVRFLILDFSRVADIDCTAVDKFAAVAGMSQAHDSILIFAGMGDTIIQRVSCWKTGSASESEPASGELLDELISDVEPPVRLFATTSAALLWCEEQLLATARHNRPPSRASASTHDSPNSSMSVPGIHVAIDHLSDETDPVRLSRPSTPGLATAAPDDNSSSPDFSIDNKLVPPTSIRRSPRETPDPAFVEMLRTITDGAPLACVTRLASYFLAAAFPRGSYIWRTGDAADFLCVVSHGLLGMERSPGVNGTTPSGGGRSSRAPSVSGEIPPGLVNSLASQQGETIDRSALLALPAAGPARRLSYPSVPRSHHPIAARGALPSMDETFPPAIRRRQQARVFTSSPLSPTHSDFLSSLLDSQRRRSSIDLPHTSELSARNAAVVVDHPVWNKTLFIHRAPYAEYFVSGQFVGEVSAMTDSRRGAAVVAVTNVKLLILTKEAIAEMTTADPYLLCLIQKIVLRNASQRMSNSARFYHEPALI